MSERYRKSLSWPEQQDRQVTRADKATWTHAISKHKVHKGMRRAVKHLQEQLLLPENVESAPTWQAVEQSEQSALQALDQLQVTLGRVLKQKGPARPGKGPAHAGHADRQDGLRLARRVEPS